MNLKEIGNIFTSKFIGNGPSSYKKIIYRAAVSQRLKNTAVDNTSSYVYKTQALTTLCAFSHLFCTTAFFLIG